MAWLSQIAFIFLLGVFGFLLVRRIRRIRANIRLGRPQKIDDQNAQRWQNVALLAFGQRKMFKKPLVAILHFFIYGGFLLINIEVLEIILDGILGTHRLFASPMGFWYAGLIGFFEALAFLVLTACIIFLIRRNVMRVDRFTNPEMKGWPFLDANLILIIESILMIAILMMNAADQQLQELGVSGYPQTGNFLFSSWLRLAVGGWSPESLVLLERVCWWFHIAGILAFAVYVTYSKHLHIFMAFPNAYYASLEPAGKVKNMPEITNEVKLMLGVPVEGDDSPPPEGLKFGAADVPHLTWKNLMDAYTCTECGRCTSECPANQTGKKLSPRKIMMDTRDRVEELGSAKNEAATNRTLLGDYISKEELNACTSCNACVEACPVMINPLDIILSLRRYVAMEESATPAAWNAMFQNIETNFAPWKFSPQDRFNWADDLKQSE